MNTFKVEFSSLEKVWFENEAIVKANSKEEAFQIVKDCIDKGNNPFAEFDATQCEVIEYIYTDYYEIATDYLSEIPYDDFVKEYYSLPVVSNLTDIQKTESSTISTILEIEIDTFDPDVFSLLELLNSSQIVSIKDFIDYDAEFLYGESVASKWNQFKKFVLQSGAKYITLTKNKKLL
ncbi:hypothetical protein ACNSOL_12430 (plasmid) [Aliarcobacter lanthieri]|uniref:hypothetical protein n=1 Tax=Aliarcobacter lanthieri TaxID=1355374 RepID=UPI003AAF2D0E